MNTITLHYPPFLRPLWENFKKIINKDESYIRNFLICTARGTGKTTSTLKLIEAFFYDKPCLINVVKKTEAKLIAFIQQFIQTVKKDLNLDLRYNSSKNEMKFGKTLIRGYTLNGEKLSVEKNPPTGLIIDQWAEGVVNIFDECAPDLKPELVNVLLQSIKTDFFKQVPKMNLFMCNPWIKGNYYISKWNKVLNWTRVKAMTEPFWEGKLYDGWYYIGASIFANPMCPESDLNTYMETTEGNQQARDIVLYGLPGALNGQIFDNFSRMTFKDFKNDFIRYYGGIDIGWTTTGGNGGATTLELFKWDMEKGLQGVLEYYHHNKTNVISSGAQQTAMLTKLCNYFNEHILEAQGKYAWINIDVGGDGSIYRTFQDDWNLHYADKCSVTVNFFPVTAGMKNKWKLYDRYQWINKCLFFNFIQVSPSIQPHLYSDLESAIYKEQTTITIEKNPVMEHEYSDTIVGGLSYAVIGKSKIWLDGWNQRYKAKHAIKSTLDTMNEPNPTSNK